ncbi:hypothetical protein QAD02_014095 [Eretmocerus hayati]|uniref:Uncharacterized protein n=1 Tax=Eretmocerus hayati TaxID=131215 RepID=A0ACC2P4C1_9HYME|nr:hypothetical protein QAD02_014095 [Eretmocerus hayati]
MVVRCSLKLKEAQTPTDAERKLYDRCDYLHKHIVHKTVVEAQGKGVNSQSDGICLIGDDRRLLRNATNSEVEQPIEEVIEESVLESPMEWQNATNFQHIPYEHDYFGNQIGSCNAEVSSNNHNNTNPATIYGDMMAPSDMDEDQVPFEKTSKKCDAPTFVVKNVKFPKKPKKNREHENIEGLINKLIPQINHEVQSLTKRDDVEYFAGSICDLFNKVSSDKRSIALKAIMSIMKKYRRM